MDRELGIGKLIGSAQQRDAIHVAIAPAVAVERLAPGQAVGFAESGDTERVSASSTPVGIVDPFLPAPVFPGDRFWMFLYPNTIKSLRHEWTHPAFTVTPTNEAERWLREFAASCCLPYDTVIGAAKEYLATGLHFVQRDSEAARSAFSESREEFWKNFEVVTGMKPSEEDRDGSVFCCTC
jgi:hypothetical protein